MPQGTTHQNPQLTDEEAWDVAAFISCHKPGRISIYQKTGRINQKNQLTILSGPMQITLSEKQHKYGPFKPIIEDQKKKEEACKTKILSSQKSKTKNLPNEK